MMIQTPTPPTATSLTQSSDPAPAPSAGKPISAICCHLLAGVALVVGLALSGAVLAKTVDDIGLPLALGCVVSAVFWWALGDIVVGVDRIARK